MSEVEVLDPGPRGMITVRADLDDAILRQAIETATQTALPDVGGVADGGAVQIAWMSPDELLVMTDYGSASATAARLREQLAAHFALVVDVSDARAVFGLRGAAWRDVLAKGSPADLRGFGPGTCRRTRLGQVACAFWAVDGGADLVVFRSVGAFVHDWLCNAARPGTLPGHLTG